MSTNFTENIVKRERAIIVTGLLLITALAWVYMFILAIDMQEMDMDSMNMAMPQMQVWAASDVLLTFIMWSVMMVAMMIPSAAPMVLGFSTINRKQKNQESIVPTAIFLSGYLVVWTAFSAIATLAQWGLHSAALLSDMMVSTSSILGGVLLITAGVFQFTRYKHACLNHCRTPMGFLMTEWRSGKQGAFVMGLRHGAFCVGCCWLIMALLFVAGVMNLLWVAAIAGYVLLEKIGPAADWLSRVAGILAIVWGVMLILGVV